MRQLQAGSGHGAVGSDIGEQRGRLFGVDLVGYPTGDEIAQHGVQPARDLGAGARRIRVTPRPELQHGRVILDTSSLGVDKRSAAMATENASWGSFLLVDSVASNRARRQLRLHVQHALAGGH